jgi:hypothetical protein
LLHVSEMDRPFADTVDHIVSFPCATHSETSTTTSVRTSAPRAAADDGTDEERR